MLSLTFEGFFECRLATDSDPSDETRGITGFTRALPGEPDLDRIIRFQAEPGRPPRKPGPEDFGVRVSAATFDGVPTNLFDQAPVHLLDSPKYEGRNGLAYDDGREPILPFHIRIEGTGVAIERKHQDEFKNWVQTSPIAVSRDNLDTVFVAFGHRSPAEFVRRRRRDLGIAIRKAPAGSIEQLALRTRRHDLKRYQRLIEAFLPYSLTYKVVMNGPFARIEDPQKRLPRPIDTSPWTCVFSMYCWDPDSLCGFVDGTLFVPLR